MIEALSAATWLWWAYSAIGLIASVLYIYARAKRAGKEGDKQ